LLSRGKVVPAARAQAYLASAALDPFGKIAEVKYCAVRVSKGGVVKALTSYGGGQAFGVEVTA
jgi:hypothetical protein